ncbi:ATP-binding protein [Chryseolinea sp. H1M3-3]|uniref:sensor histidine kinase n=1 Tax=Chryseolinea sp. H1M3-3 TaxID=3034144 RepID=UPI0023EBDC51|nr:ATP-binding protein [Chryseolinea sp. H1M3-3]
MEHRSKRRTVVIGFVVIVILLAGNILLTYRNSVNINRNTALQNRSERIKTIVSYIAIDIIHNLDLGIRSYALFKDERYLYPYHKALDRKDSILQLAETVLKEENYSMDEFNLLKDSIEAYVALNKNLKLLVDENNIAAFIGLADRDKGYHLWLQYEHFARAINDFENVVLQNAKARYHAALRNNYVLQILLFLICVPTLIFTIRRTFKEFELERQLRAAEIERADLLKSQNERLEQMVADRTSEITEKNRELQRRQDEIEAQNEEMRSQNDQLVRQQEEIVEQRDLVTLQNNKLTHAQEIILQQQAEIRNKNEYLEIEVARKTKELLNNNQQLEQFAFASAHNLRGPVARILGLGNVLSYSRHDREEEQLIIKNIIKSTVELDVTIKDLTTILNIRSNVTARLSNINFSDEMQIIKSNLAKDLWETGGTIVENFDEAPNITSVKAYIDSILFNLISNAIKFRSPERPLFITVRTSKVSEFVCLEVTDNGLGIDLTKYGNEIFSLYKRFHSHTEGKGLGLHLVKMQAAAAGGHVEVKSIPDEGSTFSVYLRDHAESHEKDDGAR